MGRYNLQTNFTNVISFGSYHPSFHQELSRNGTLPYNSLFLVRYVLSESFACNRAAIFSGLACFPRCNTLGDPTTPASMRQKQDRRTNKHLHLHIHGI